MCGTVRGRAHSGSGGLRSYVLGVRVRGGEGGREGGGGGERGDDSLIP